MRFARLQILRSAAAAGLAGILLAGTAAADPIADFYTGKTVRIVVGSAPGGGYDLYARLYVRPFIVPPEVPADRLKALQSAFKATLEDPEFLAEAKKGEVEIRYVSPERVQASLSQVLDAPVDVRDAAIDQLRQSGWGGL